MKTSKFLAAFFLLAITPVHAESLTVFNDASEDLFIDHQAESSTDQKILWNSELQTLQGKKLGMSAGTCQRVDTEGNFYCSLILDLTGEGQISATGLQGTEPQPSTMVITGGTESFQGIIGKIVLQPVEDRARFRFDLEFEVP